ncbi:MAG: ABC transporter permease [Chloroflexi bacterium]|nr:ABC transporter permease [Chloroflexota bacterium]
MRASGAQERPAGAVALLGQAPLRGRARHWTINVLWRLLREKPLGVFGGAIVLAMIVVAIFAPLIAPYPANAMHPQSSVHPPGAQFWFGTDQFGRDLFSRIVHGSRISLFVGFVAVGIGASAATAIGMLSGYFGGKLDLLLQRAVDAVMSFPWLIIVMSIMGIVGPGMLNVAVVLGILTTAGSSRVIRGAALSVKESQYVDAARALGAGHGRIILVHILPNISAPIIIIATLGLGTAILAESSLSFLGYGIPQPAPAWGSMLSLEGRRYMLTAPWIAIFPGVAISLIVFGFNMLGDALRDVLDPRLRGT